ncbi:hypothetical protein D3C76_469720 [compost metagenome]
MGSFGSARGARGNIDITDDSCFLQLEMGGLTGEIQTVNIVIDNRFVLHLAVGNGLFRDHQVKAVVGSFDATQFNRINTLPRNQAFGAGVGVRSFVPMQMVPVLHPTKSRLIAEEIFVGVFIDTGDRRQPCTRHQNTAPHRRQGIDRCPERQPMLLRSVLDTLDTAARRADIRHDQKTIE